jgi:hypothetical protein
MFPRGTPPLRNFNIDDYLAMCRDGEAEFSVSEAARVMGVSRAYLYRCMDMAAAPDDEFEAALSSTLGKGQTTTTALADELSRRAGTAKAYDVRCPHCGGVLYTRTR